MKMTARQRYITLAKRTLWVGFLCLATVATTSASFEDFLQTLEKAGLDTSSVLEAQTISRYETARILNMIDCQDCINPSPDYVAKYTPDYRTAFSQLPTASFDDIIWGGGIHQDKSYYYCVAYVGDQGYMRGYNRQSSPICPGKFCGTNNTTTAEYLQMILNTVPAKIYTTTQAPWRNIQKNYQNTSINDHYKTIIEKAINQCPSGTCSLRTKDELHAYLAYCRHHLDTCDMEPIAGLKEGAWPVSELNFLRKNGLLSSPTSIQPQKPITGRQALELAYQAFNKNSCNFNNDYDCDGWINSEDNCPNTYNPSQTDTDHDQIGDVCDEDIDGDERTNPKGIIDERNRINIEKLEKNPKDTCIRDPRPNEECDKLPDAGLRIEAQLLGSAQGTLSPFEVTATIFGPGPITRKINGTTLPETGKKIRYQPTESGLYVIQASQKGIHQTATASSSVRIAEAPKRTYMMRDEPKTLTIGGKKRTKITHLTNQANPIYERTINGKKIENTTNSITFRAKPGIYTIQAKIDKYTTQMTLSCDGNECISATLQTTGPRELNQEYHINTAMTRISSDDIFRIKWFDGVRIRYTSKPETSITPTQSGPQTVTQIITLIDGTILTQKIKLYITQPDTGENHVFNSIDQNENQTNTTNGNTTTSTTKISECLILQASETATNQEKEDNINNDKKAPNCAELYRTGKIKQYKCDLDKDGTPDICDADIDGDGVQNPIGILLKENNNCSYTPDIINRGILGGKNKNENNNKRNNNTGKNITQNTNNKNNTGNTNDKNKKYTTDPNLIRQLLNNTSSYIGFNNLSCAIDNCPFVINPQQIDINQNGIGNICDITNTNNDRDNDGIPNTNDPCPHDSTNTCSQKDWDKDSRPDHKDPCPYDPKNQCTPTDQDGDGIADNADKCPRDPTNTCNQDDWDNDGIPNIEDSCPYDPLNICKGNNGNNGNNNTEQSNDQIINKNSISTLTKCAPKKPHIMTINCDMCPCQVATFDAQLQPGDSILTKLYDPFIIHPRSSSSPRMIDF